MHVGKLEIPSHFTLIMRALVILSGVSHTLVPNERVIGSALARTMLRTQLPAVGT